MASHDLLRQGCDSSGLSRQYLRLLLQGGGVLPPDGLQLVQQGGVQGGEGGRHLQVADLQ